MEYLVILVPIYHSEYESLVEKVLNESSQIYWESLLRSNNNPNGKWGLEDPLLLSFFELTLVIMAWKDDRVFNSVYKGTGTVYPGVIPSERLSHLARNAAKSCQAILGIRKSGIIGLVNLTKYIDIEEVIRNKGNEKYLVDHMNKMVEIYDEFTRILSKMSIYRKYIDQVILEDLIGGVNKDSPIDVSIDYCLECKEYVSNARNQSNADYVMKTMKSRVIFVCVGSAHISALRYIFNGNSIETIQLDLKEEDDAGVISDHVNQILKYIKADTR